MILGPSLLENQEQTFDPGTRPQNSNVRTSFPRIQTQNLALEGAVMFWVALHEIVLPITLYKAATFSRSGAQKQPFCKNSTKH